MYWETLYETSSPKFCPQLARKYILQTSTFGLVVLVKKISQHDLGSFTMVTLAYRRQNLIFLSAFLTQSRKIVKKSRDNCLTFIIPDFSYLVNNYVAVPFSFEEIKQPNFGNLYGMKPL